VVIISRCGREDPGSIPGHGILFSFLLVKKDLNPVLALSPPIIFFASSFAEQTLFAPGHGKLFSFFIGQKRFEPRFGSFSSNHFLILQSSSLLLRFAEQTLIFYQRLNAELEQSSIGW
jgi:hypothetical protein